MQITIISVTYQSVKTLQDAIESVLAQTYPHIEYIVIDGGSTDGTQALLAQYGNRITRWISEPDGGIYDAMNKGLQLATGDYTGYLHADDLLADNTIIEKMVDALRQQDADVIYGDLEYVQKEDTNQVIRYWQSCNFKPSLLKNGWMPPHPTVYVRTSIFKMLSGFDTSFRISADYHFLLKLFSLTAIKPLYFKDVIVKMRVGGASNRSLKNIILKSREDLRALQLTRIGGFISLMKKNFGKLHQFISRKS